MDNPHHSYWVIIITVIVALALSIMPLPIWAQWGRPEWLVLVLLYWVIALPHRVGVVFAWCAGLVLDILEHSPLGMNALSLAVVAYLALNVYRRMRMYSFLQQAFLVFLMVCLYVILCFWVENLKGVTAHHGLLWLPALVSGLIWPVVMLTLRFLRRYFDVR